MAARPKKAQPKTAQLTVDCAKLAAHYGIEGGFRDARGQDIVTSEETQKRLLAAMGVDVSTARKAAAEWKRVSGGATALAPVIVARSQAGGCAVTVSAPPETTRLAWRVTLEDGTERNGSGDLLAAQTARATTQSVPRTLRLDEIPCGYHVLHLPELDVSASLIVTLGHCWLPDGFDVGAGLWGLSVQLYLLRSQSNWGIGDFADLVALATWSAPRGCNVIGVNPLHQMMLDDPQHASPYSPLTRLYLNVLNIAVPDVPGYATSADLQKLMAASDFKARLSACRAAELVDYDAVAALKIPALKILYRDFGAQPPATRESFETFRNAHGDTLRRCSIFQALRHHFTAQDKGLADWHAWPDDYRDCASAAVEQFAQTHGEEIAFLDWLQWVADEQLAAAARAASDLGMTIRLYRDLAVGCDRSGAETWTSPTAFLSGAQVGAPPDIFNPAGQNWGLPPFNPQALRADGYRDFIALIRANMRHAGGLRIDHVMGLTHLYCIPEGSTPADGAYVSYDLDDLVGILALESQRHRCLVVGEDLGTVPDGFRETMADANVLSYRVLFFEQDWERGAFIPPDRYPRLAVAVAGSHDLPTLSGWMAGRDIDLKESLGLYPTQDEGVTQRERRAKDFASLLDAFREQGLAGPKDRLSPKAFAATAHDFLTRSRSALIVMQLDDLIGEIDQVNVPGTSSEHPNWRRKYRKTLEEIATDANVWRLAGHELEKRGGPPSTGPGN